MIVHIYFKLFVYRYSMEGFESLDLKCFHIKLEEPNLSKNWESHDCVVEKYFDENTVFMCERQFHKESPINHGNRNDLISLTEVFLSR